MSLTTILSISEKVTINDHRFVGQMISRNQILTTSEVLTVVPFSFEMQPMNYLLYSKNRNLLAALRYADKSLEQYLNFPSTGWLNYVAYQGGLTGTQVASCQWQTSSANKTLVLGNLPSVASGTYIVKAGDFCQVGRYTYIATQDVLRGSGSTVNIPIHRSLMTTVTSPINAVIGQYGTTQPFSGGTFTGVTFPVLLREYPTYTLTPITNDSFISWTGIFTAYEAVL